MRFALAIVFALAASVAAAGALRFLEWVEQLKGAR